MEVEGVRAESSVCRRVLILLRASLPLLFRFRLHENQEIRVVLSCVNLLLDPADTGLVLPNDDEEIFRVETHALAVVDDLDVSEPLLVR